MRTVWKKIFSHVDKLIKFTRKYACNALRFFENSIPLFWPFLMEYYPFLITRILICSFNLVLMIISRKKKKSMLLSIKYASDTWCDKWWPIFITWASYAYLLRDLYSRTEGNPLASSFGHLHVLDLYKRWPRTTLYNCTEFKQDLWLI